MRKFLYLVICETLFFHHASLGETIVAAKRTHDFLVIAADSRVTNIEGQARDYEECKIHLLDDRSIFVGVGVTSDKGEATAFSAAEEARTHYASYLPLQMVAQKWATAMEAKYYILSGLWKQEIVAALKKFGVEDNVFIQGVFGRVDGSVEALEEKITYEESSLTVTFSHGEPAELIDDETSITLWGTKRGRMEVAELLRGETARSVSWRATVAQQAISRGFRRIDGYALELESALEEVIAAHVDPAIGGDVAVLILQTGRPVRWFRQPHACLN